MYFLSIPLRNVARRPLRASLSALGVALAVAGFLALMGLARGTEHAWVKALVARDTHVMVTRKGAIEILTASIDEHLATALQQVPGVNAVAGELVDLMALAPEQPVLVAGWAPHSFLWQTLQLNAGSLPAPDDTKGLVLGQAMAETLRLKPGDTLDLLGQAFVITGIARPAGTMNNNMVFLPLRAMQALVNRPDRVTVFNVRLEHADDAALVQQSLHHLREAFPTLTFTETSAIAESNDMLRMGRAMAWGTSLIALVMGMLGVLNALLMSVTERIRELGVLSAVGWRPGRILAMIVLEGLAITLAGSAVGTLLGLYGLYGLARLPLFRGFLEPAVDLRMLLEVGAATLLLGIVGSLYPAWRGVRLNPIDALKYE